MRARNIKPGFFENEDLAECSPSARLLFIGLWCYADREGRFEWRPKKIRLQILPLDECNPDELLSELLSKQLINKYSVNGNDYGYIPNFLKHQKPHVREAQSTIPAPAKALPRQDPGNGEHLPRRPDSLNPDIHIKNIQFPLRGNVTFTLEEDKIKAYQKTYPNIDVIQCLKECRQWNEDNPGKRKTKTGILKHINTWLKREQEKKGYVASAPDYEDHNREPDPPPHPEHEKKMKELVEKAFGGEMDNDGKPLQKKEYTREEVEVFIKENWPDPVTKEQEKEIERFLRSVRITDDRIPTHRQ